MALLQHNARELEAETMTAWYQGLLQNWYATPLATAQASHMRQQSEHYIQTNMGGRMLRLPHIALMCARFWLEDFHQHDFELLGHSLTQPRRVRALLWLVYGQLLIATKQSSAFGYLETGLKLADGLMKPQDYFEVYNRHQALRSLRLSPQRAAGQTLESLLTEAAVIDKLTLKGAAEMTFRPSRFDTLINKRWN
jgi:hypothetical protein